VARQPVDRKQAEQEDFRLSQAVHECFSTPAGQTVLEYLRYHFVRSVMAPSTPPNELFYREGQRSIVGIIDTRMKEAERGR
jgi:hypothetical protein